MGGLALVGQRLGCEDDVTATVWIHALGGFSGSSNEAREATRILK